MKPISQREARQLRKRVRELEARDRALRSSFGYSYSGAHLGTMTITPLVQGWLEVCAKLGHVVVVRREYANAERVNLYAIPTEAMRNV